MTESTEQPPTDRVDEDAIRARAYEISQQEDAGTPEENWERAEREVRGEAQGE